ncbi:hydrolase Nlp/P60 [Variovorax sp. RO1]|uniref:C40 family peptidase n=1 Tax=Variovorax sp. RO1 TaxID=2066034 RepID=UPI000C716DF7|nr:C40 family peptidase [Variovorax sp. RO1]PLC06532.1 hydrolase Nlp/P60 [Variovorax sp. RO1]
MLDTSLPTPSRSSPASLLLSQRLLFRLIPAVTACLLAIGCASPPPTRTPGGSVPSSNIPPLTSEQSNSITIHALGLVGTPYRYGGNSPEGGFDCSGLIGYVYRQSVGQVPPRTVSRMAGFGRPVPMSELRSGDLVLFGSASPTHAGIYVGDGRFVHAPSTGGEVRLDRLDGVYWSRQPTQARRPG